MITYGLVGKSGTGKSFQAMNLCHKRNIEAVIDDGLFIYGSGIQAGISAKREETKIGAVKTALFTKEEHRKAVADRIREINPSTLLILGTSEGMIHRIAERLELPPVSEMISIEDITTEKQRSIARRQRQDLGKHVIPAPTFQVKRQFSGYFLDPLSIFRGKGRVKSSFNDKTVVRPTYSYLGDYVISDKVLSDIVEHVAASTPGISAVLRTVTDNQASGLSLRISIVLSYSSKIMAVAREFQQRLAQQIEQMTAFNILSVDIEIRGLK